MNVDAKGMEAANLSPAQVNELKEAEKKLNGGKATPEIYLLAVQRGS
ncbi:MAG: hypothetical protein M0Z41_18255 [Peptococcaceae bacterium]|jgi:hypothetical protein|nr:hypothetical protein [Peptococcaceae bacterium]